MEASSDTLKPVKKIAGVSIAFLAFFALPHSVHAAEWTGSCVSDGAATIKGLECAFTNVVTAVFGLAAVVLFCTFLIGGFKYLTSGSDPKAVEAAKQTLTAAIAGLVLLVLAYVILVIIEQITGAKVTIFNVTNP